jgi:hypothetical protein
MHLCSEIQIANILGVYTEVYQKSKKDRLPMKKYIGVCSQESIQIKITRVMFPDKVTK